MGRTALIGYSGFVGSNIHAKQDFDDLYNTSNFDQIVGRHYDLVVSAVGRADSHRINQAPDEDRESLRRFAQVLQTVSIDELVHMSTVCVFDASDRCDEDTTSDAESLTPYGRHRLELERVLLDSFGALCIRLPQLFGPGIKKGLIYDLMNDYRVGHIRPGGVFQHYDLTRLWADITTARDAGVSVLNLATEPVANARVASEVFGIELSAPDGEESRFVDTYTRNMITKYAATFGMTGDYLMSADDELDAIRSFVAAEGDRVGTAKTGPFT